MIRVYIAGPITAPTIAAYKKNIDRARDASLHLMQKGYATHCPHAETAYMDGELTYEQFLEIDFAWLEMADAIALIPGWQNSYGACIELKEALRRGLTVLRLRQFETEWDVYRYEKFPEELAKQMVTRIAQGRVA